MHYDPVQQGSAGLYRCCDCGLVQRPQENALENAPCNVDEPLFEIALKQILRKTGPVAHSSMLIIGHPPHSTLSHIRDSELHVTILLDYEEETDVANVATVQTCKLESAPFRPEQFDVILCARRTDTMRSTASVLTKSRLWLRPGGLLFMSGTNWESIERKTFRRKWHHSHKTGTTFLEPKHVKDYASRYGFTLLSSGTRSRIEEIASIAFNTPTPSFVSQSVVIPLWLLSTLPGLGDTWWGILVKRDYVTRPLLRKIGEEAERTPGLATAGYSSTQREMTETAEA